MLNYKLIRLFNQFQELSMLFEYCFQWKNPLTFLFFRIFEKVPTVMIPAFWFAQTIELDEKLAKQAKVNFSSIKIFISIERIMIIINSKFVIDLLDCYSTAINWKLCSIWIRWTCIDFVDCWRNCNIHKIME